MHELYFARYSRYEENVKNYYNVRHNEEQHKLDKSASIEEAIQRAETSRSFHVKEIKQKARKFNNLMTRTLQKNKLLQEEQFSEILAKKQRELRLNVITGEHEEQLRERADLYSSKQTVYLQRVHDHQQLVQQKNEQLFSQLQNKFAQAEKHIQQTQQNSLDRYRSLSQKYYGYKQKAEQILVMKQEETLCQAYEAMTRRQKQFENHQKKKTQLQKLIINRNQTELRKYKTHKEQQQDSIHQQQLQQKSQSKVILSTNEQPQYYHLTPMALTEYMPIVGSQQRSVKSINEPTNDTIVKVDSQNQIEPEITIKVQGPAIDRESQLQKLMKLRLRLQQIRQNAESTLETFFLSHKLVSLCESQEDILKYIYEHKWKQDSGQVLLNSILDQIKTHLSINLTLEEFVYEGYIEKCISYVIQKRKLIRDINQSLQNAFKDSEFISLPTKHRQQKLQHVLVPFQQNLKQMNSCVQILSRRIYLEQEIDLQPHKTNLIKIVENFKFEMNCLQKEIESRNIKDPLKVLSTIQNILDDELLQSILDIVGAFTKLKALMKAQLILIEKFKSVQIDENTIKAKQQAPTPTSSQETNISCQMIETSYQNSLYHGEIILKNTSSQKENIKQMTLVFVRSFDLFQLIQMKGGVFNPRPALNLDKNQITAMDAFQGVMFTGDQNGNIYRYQLTPEDVWVVQANSVQSKSITKSRVDTIKCVPYLQNSVLFLSDSTLFVIDSGLKAEVVSKEKVHSFAINEFSKSHQTEVIVVTKKKEGIIYNYNTKSGKYEQFREKFLLPDLPVTIAFIGSFFYFGIAKKNYHVINLEDKQLAVTNLPIDIGQYPHIKGTEHDEILVITVNNIGIFIGRDGQMKQKSTINMQNSQFQCIVIFKPYLIILFDKLIQVFNLTDAKQMADIVLQASAKCITQTSSHLFYANQTELVYLYQTPFEVQIQDLLKKGNVEDALQVYQQYNQVPDPAKIEQLKLDCGWSLVRQMSFKEAQQYLFQANFDPRDFICLFPDYYYAIQKLSSANENPSKFTISLVISQFVQDQFKNDPKKLQEFKLSARDFFIEVLEKRRAVFTSPQYAYSMKDKLHLLTSSFCYNANKWLPIPCDEMLELIDFAIMKAYIDAGQYLKLKQFLTGNQIYCISMYAELQAILQSNKTIAESHQGILARFYESFNKIDLSLEMWRSLSDSPNAQVWEEACEETIRIMKANPEKNRIQKFITWVFRKSFTIGTRLFAFSDAVITPDQMIKFLDELEGEPDLKRRLKERYLEVLVVEKQTEEERFHTQLAYSYIDALFSIVPRDTELEKVDLSKNKIAFDYYQALKRFLKNPNAKYNSSSILEKKVKDSWMIPEQIQLYGREKRHDEALMMLLKLRVYEQAEKYCRDYNDNLLTRLFKKYIELYTYQQQIAIDKPTDPKAQTDLKEVKVLINNFLKKYATDPQLNPLEVLEMIPEKWLLADQGPEDGLFQFLNSVISHTLHQKRSTKAAYHLSDMDLLNVECLYAEAKQANIRITTEKKCAVCNRAIGDKVFVVYPNAVVAHHTCIKNNTVCPLTEKDFEKYFKF